MLKKERRKISKKKHCWIIQHVMPPHCSFKSTQHTVKEANTKTSTVHPPVHPPGATISLSFKLSYKDYCCFVVVLSSVKIVWSCSWSILEGPKGFCLQNFTWVGRDAVGGQGERGDFSCPLSWCPWDISMNHSEEDPPYTNQQVGEWGGEGGGWEAEGVGWEFDSGNSDAVHSEGCKAKRSEWVCVCVCVCVCVYTN